MIPQLLTHEALDQATMSARGRIKDERVGVARTLSFSSYTSHWWDEADGTRPAHFLGRFDFRIRRKPSGVIITNEEAVPLRITTDRSHVIRRWLTPATRIGLQLAGLSALNYSGFWVVHKTALPIPGNLVGMLTLFVLLVAGVVRVSWFELTGSFLIKHLAFFFVPITVGLMNAGPLLLTHGLGIILVLTISAAGGILLTGLISQALLAKRWRAGDRL